MAKISNSKSLPNKPSKLIRVALKDLRLVERSKTYDIDMGVYHSPKVDSNTGQDIEVCRVCFAGSVIAKTFKADPGLVLGPGSPIFDKITSKKLMALDRFREGKIVDAFELMKIKIPLLMIKENVDITSYYDDPTKFKKELSKLADDLEHLGF
jgi:hypothetical protein